MLGLAPGHRFLTGRPATGSIENGKLFGRVSSDSPRPGPRKPINADLSGQNAHRQDHRISRERKIDGARHIDKFPTYAEIRQWHHIVPHLEEYLEHLFPDPHNYKATRTPKSEVQKMFRVELRRYVSMLRDTVSTASTSEIVRFFAICRMCGVSLTVLDEVKLNHLNAQRRAELSADETTAVMQQELSWDDNPNVVNSAQFQLLLAEIATKALHRLAEEATSMSVEGEVSRRVAASRQELVQQLAGELESIDGALLLLEQRQEMELLRVLVAKNESRALKALPQQQKMELTDE